MRVLQRSSVAVLAVGLVGALAVPGCGSKPIQQAADPTPTASSEPTSEPTAQPEPSPDDSVELDWQRMLGDVALTADGSIYASAAAGIAVFDEGTGAWTVVDTDGLPEGDGLDESLPGRSIGSIATAPDGALWAAGSAYSGVDDAEFGVFVEGWGDPVRALSWVARGACEGAQCTWELFDSDVTRELMTTEEPATWPPEMGDIVIGADGTFYASSGDNDLLVFDGVEWTSYTVPHLPTAWDGGVSPWSGSLAIDRDGVLWAGTNDPGAGRGLFTFDGEEFTRLTTDDGLPSDNVFQVSVADDGTVWVATDTLYDNPAAAAPDAAAGVASFDGTTWTTYTLDDGLLSNDGVVAAGPDGTAWVVHSEIPARGYAHFDGAEWTAYPSEEPLGGFRAVVDADGTLWTVDPSGLIRFDGITKTVYPSPFLAQPTPVPAVFSFADHDLCEWVSEDEVAEFVAAEFDWEGTAELNGRPLEADACEWALSGDYAVEVGVRDVGQWKDFDGNPYEITVNGDPYTVPERVEVVDYEGGPVEIGAFVVGHPAVSDGVVVHNGAFGQFAFGVPPDSEWLQVWLAFPQDEGEWDEAYEAKFFAVADHFVEELGWLADG